ncbi:MAG: Crp/Fnr family transcriptional regulator [Candidatus Levybacteria bacterium]|nr:Crp/Fnr family transcriptional regulator [Candidatus Levybacteria bacterium]
MINQTLSSQLDAFFKHTPIHFYKKRVMILHPNDTPSSVFYVKNGYVRVFRLTEDGEELTLTILKPGDFFPLTYGFNKSVNPYYLEAITPLELWQAPQEDFIKFVTAAPDVLYDLTTRIMVRFDGVFSRMEYLVLSNAYIKVATTLLVCAKRFGRLSGDNDIVIDVPLTHRDIATLVGITRETTSLEMKKLEKEGYLGRSGRLLIIKNIKRFEKNISLVPQNDSQIRYSL